INHNFQYGSLLEFSPRGAPPEAMPVVLWNRTDPETSNVGRGRLLRSGKVWVAERVTQADQGNYTVRDSMGKVVSRSTLTVRGETIRRIRLVDLSVEVVVQAGELKVHSATFRRIYCQKWNIIFTCMFPLVYNHLKIRIAMSLLPPCFCSSPEQPP
uniref:Uncharacterized protein n=1 Tax=Dicentrarchus labrax TaxID=13489 RepID=A0A8C4EBU3_DICLA